MSPLETSAKGFDDVKKRLFQMLELSHMTTRKELHQQREDRLLVVYKGISRLNNLLNQLNDYCTTIAQRVWYLRERGIPVKRQESRWYGEMVVGVTHIRNYFIRLRDQFEDEALVAIGGANLAPQYLATQLGITFAGARRKSDSYTISPSDTIHPMIRRCDAILRVLKDGEWIMMGKGESSVAELQRLPCGVSGCSGDMSYVLSFRYRSGKVQATVSCALHKATLIDFCSISSVQKIDVHRVDGITQDEANEYLAVIQKSADTVFGSRLRRFVPPSSGANDFIREN